MNIARKIMGSALVAVVAMVLALVGTPAQAEAGDGGDDAVRYQQQAAAQYELLKDQPQPRGTSDCEEYLDVRGYEWTTGIWYACFVGATWTGGNGYTACVGFLKFEDVRWRHVWGACLMAQLP